MKIIASDFDGTLVRNGPITERDRDAIARWQAAGNLFGLVTGRDGSILDECNGLGVTLDFAIVHNGATVLDRNGKLLHADTFDAALAHAYYNYSYGESGYTFRHEKPDLSQYVGRVSQVELLMHNTNDAQVLSDILNQKFGDKLNSFTNGTWINTVPFGVNKATGIARLAEHFGVSKEDIFAVGDNYNDLSMLQAYDGYIVASACEGMKQLIPNVCEDIAHLTEIAGL